LVEKVLFADDFTRNRIKEEQLKASQEMRTELFLRNFLFYFLVPGLTDSQGRPIPQEIDDSLMTPYGPPDRNARILPVPNDCVGLIIGKNGETIRRLHRETACKIQVIPIFKLDRQKRNSKYRREKCIYRRPSRKI
jgi:hypothetical protein